MESILSDNKYRKNKMFIRNCAEIVFCAIFVYRKTGCVYGTMNVNNKERMHPKSDEKSEKIRK